MRGGERNGEREGKGRIDEIVQKKGLGVHASVTYQLVDKELIIVTNPA